EKDFTRWAGHVARVETAQPIDGRRRFKGTLLGLDAGAVRLRLDDGTEAQVPLAAVAKAKLELTDALLDEHHRAQEGTEQSHRWNRREEDMMGTTADIPRLEMLQVADMVAREKGIEREEVLEAMEQAIQKAGRAKYGLEHDIRAEIDRKSGEIKLLRYMQVADPIENENTQVSVVEAQRRNPEAQVGDFLTDELPPIDFGRVAAQTAKQVITQRMRESERKRQYEEFKDRVGEIVSGVVKRVDYGNITV